MSAWTPSGFSASAIQAGRIQITGPGTRAATITASRRRAVPHNSWARPGTSTISFNTSIPATGWWDRLVKVISAMDSI